MRRSRNKFARLVALATVSGPVSLLLLVIAPSPAFATVSYGVETTQTYTIQFSASFNGQPGGTGTCTVSYSLGPDVANTPLGLAAGLGVQSSVSGGGCAGPGAPDDFDASTSASGPNSAACSGSGQYIGGYSTGAPGASASCDMPGYSGWYSAQQHIDMDIGGGWTLQMTNSVPGCSNNAGGYVTCDWTAWYNNSSI